MKYVISASGGLGSAVSAMIAHENGLDYECVFADTKIEDEDLYRFLGDVNDALKCKFVHLQDGRTPWQVFRDVRFIGNQQKAQCSHFLKRVPVRGYMRRTYAPDEAMLVLGMGTSELDRLERAQKQWSPYTVVSLLREYRVTPGMYQSYLDRYNIRRPRLYGYGFPHNNCGGFCVRAGQKQFVTLLTHFPELYAHHESEEQSLLAELPTARPFLEKSFNGRRRGISMKEFRERFERGEITIDPYDWAGCGCFTDEE